MQKIIPLSVPNITGNEIKYTTQALETEWVSTSGSYITTFEKCIAQYVKTNDSVACQSGTAGLHLSLLSIGVQPNDEVIVPTLTFIAAVNPVIYVNAHPVFMDCDDTLCMDMQKLSMFITNECYVQNEQLFNKISNRHIVAVLVVHVFGNIADMDTLMLLAEKYNFKVIEDATEALGSYFITGKYKGKYAGTIGDMGVYSFNGNKIITTGGGGMVVSNNVASLKRARYLSTQAKDDELYFVHKEVGYNYRMTNVQATLGVAQMERLDEFIQIKANRYDLYKNIGIPLLPFRDDIRTNHWFYSYLTPKRNELITYLSGRKIQSRPVWHLIHKLEPYKDCQYYQIEKAVYYWERIVNIPCSTNLSIDDVKIVADAIKSFT